MERLPRGRHGLPREFVAQNQRERLLAALAECLEEKGYDRTTVSAVGKRAGVSKSDFYKQFASKDACFVAAYDDAVERIRGRVLAICAERKDWATGVLAALDSLLELLAAEPAQTQLVLVEGLRAGRGVYDRYQVALQSFVPYLRDGAPAPAGGEPPPAATDEAVVGGIASLLARRVLAGETKELPALLPEIAEFALTPYVGTAEARRIISGR
ncbi:MAG TPA: helix-turn-helix domain-containing protein [Solirubrobacterales bacterium]|nr:helix-turn-helix domain-containing protein [Solirubrobacterales bacterium]